MQADLAMYSVKNSGKNSYRSFDEGMMEDQVRRSSIESLIWKSLEEDGFFMVYQPKVSLKTGEIVGYEALVRMRDCFFSPAEFIPVAEGNGSIVKLGRQVALMVVRQMAVWQEAGMVLRPVSINFSGNQLQDVDFVSFLEGLLLEYGVAASLIEIEITENIFLDDKAGTMEFLHKIKKLGMGISIDDFGTGYSSLNYLTFLPADVIKLDRSLIVKFLEFENPGVLDSMVSLVHSLGLKVVAEGVESWDQIGRLCASHCDFVQGFVFSKPIGAEEVPEFNGRVFELE